MFSSSRDPRGGLTPLISGIALLLLGGMLPALVPPSIAVPGMGVCALGALGCGIVWWRARQAAKYDLSRLWDSPAVDPVDRAPELHNDFPEPDEGAALYCASCDEVYPEGTYRCRHCGRQLS